MEPLLSSEKQAEMIPFNWDAPILYYPVRHHSPVCAYHLEQILERYDPDCILVEGPENANELVPILTDPNTVAPVALYYAYRDDAHLLQNEDEEEPAQCQCYYPFLDHSPELVALRAAAAKGIPGYFIDLPYGEILLSTQDTRGLRTKEEKISYANDRYLANNQFITRLCERAGLRSFAEFWEKYFEVGGMYRTSEAFVRQMNTYCLLSRKNTPQQELLDDGCLAREAHMAQRIQEAAQQHERVLVVAGGFHIWGLLHPTSQPNRPKLAKDSQMVYPMRYSIAAADALNGYASGMVSAGFYAKIWAALHQDPPTQAWDGTVLHYLVRVGRRLRAKGETISAFDEICALNQARGLAELRDKPAPGFFELQDAVLSNFVKGEATLAGSEPMRILRELTMGDKVGQLCDGALVPPLMRDFDRKCQQYRLKQREISKQEVTLSIFSEPRHREMSRFFYQTVFLGCDFAERKKGPDLRKRTERSLIREIWTYHWSTTVEAALIEQSVLGSTMEEASAAQLKRQMAQTNRASAGADLLMQGFLMGIGDVSDHLAQQMDELLIQDGDFLSLCRACSSLNTLEEWQTQYDERGTYDYPSLLRRCFTRVLQMLPSMNTVNDEAVQDVQQACRLLYQVTERENFADERPELLRVFELLVKKQPIHPALHGAVLGLLYGADTKWQEHIKYTIASYLLGTTGMMVRSASFLQGLFYTAKDLLLIDHEFSCQIDTLFSELTDEQFTSILPELRLAFSYFVPMEISRLAKQAAALHGGRTKSLRTIGIDAEEYSRIEKLDAWAAARLDSVLDEGGEFDE